MLEFKIVILDNAYANWENPEVRDLFSHVVSLKKSGYSKAYGEQTIPCSESDFIGTHILVCNDQMIPVMGHLSISLERADSYRVSFPGLGLVKNFGSEQHIQAVEKIIESCRYDKKSLSYEANWTILPSVAENRRNLVGLHKLFKAIHILYLDTYRMDESLLGGALRFGVDKVFSDWGYKPVQVNGKELDPLKVTRMNNTPVLLMHLQARDESALQYAEKYRSVWSERNTVGETLIKRAA